jgi:hypothetical protein
MIFLLSSYYLLIISLLSSYYLVFRSLLSDGHPRQVGDECRFDVIIETLRATNLGDLKVGSKANYERSARMGDEIGGHSVSGHVDCKATITSVKDSDFNRRIEFTVPQDRMKYILAKVSSKPDSQQNVEIKITDASAFLGDQGWFGVRRLDYELTIS